MRIKNIGLQTNLDTDDDSVLTVTWSDDTFTEAKMRRNGRAADMMVAFKEAVNAKIAPKPSDDNSLDQIIALVNPREKINDARRRMFNARLKEYSFEEIRNAAYAFSKSEWHKENGRMSVDYLLAPSKFGHWYLEGQKDKTSAGPTAEDDAEFERQEEANRRFREGES